jgi:hypothetical protein
MFDLKKASDCIKCTNKLLQYQSVKTGFCTPCRSELLPDHIPQDQEVRYLERIAPYYEILLRIGTYGL